MDHHPGNLNDIPALRDLSRRTPKHLFYRGTWNPEIFTKCMAIVGSRRITSYGQKVIEKIVPGLVQQGWTIVSGFMYGVDQAAHTAAVENGGKTIAVLGWGINYEPVQPRPGELIISEWEDQEPALWTFPYRNRIVAAMSQEVIVVEAAVKSGSLITANMAAKLKRPVWAVPGPLTSKVSAGTNQLIADGLAKMWQEIPLVSQTSSINNTEIYITLQNDMLTVDEISIKTGKSAAELGAELSMLVLTGEVLEKDGKYFLP